MHRCRHSMPTSPGSYEQGRYFDLMLRVQGWSPVALRGKGGGAISLPCIDLHARLTANLPASGLPRLASWAVWQSGSLAGWVPVLQVQACFCGSLLALLLKIVLDCGATLLTCHRRGEEASRSLAAWSSGDLQASGQAAVSPGGTARQRRLPDAPCNPCPVPPRTPPTNGQADRLFVNHHARLSALLLQIIREPTQTPPGPGSQSNPLPTARPRPTSWVLEPSRSGESCLRAERRRREHVTLLCYGLYLDHRGAVYGWPSLR